MGKVKLIRYTGVTEAVERDEMGEMQKAHRTKQGVNNEGHKWFRWKGLM